MFDCPPAIAREIARLQYTCLDDRWLGGSAVYRFQCYQGHVIQAKGAGLAVHKSCRLCREKVRIQRMQDRAVQDGSQCLDDQWQGQHHHYRFRCSQDPSHEWGRTYPFAVQNARCPHCARIAYGEQQRDRDGSQKLQAYAASRGGECLSPVYKGVDYSYRFRCAQGHCWEAVANHMFDSQGWCRQCFNDRLRHRIEDIQRAAQERGGRFLSSEYQNTQTPYTWACAKGHTWQAPYRKIQRGSWCPTCTPGNPRLDARALQESAQKHGGRCLSSTYLGVVAKYQWECAQGHTWSSTLSTVRRGHWCPECATKNRSLGLDDLRRAALERGGRCLAKTYKGCGSKYQWICAQGHSWYTTFSAIRSGSWCPACHFMSRTRPGSSAWLRYQSHTSGDSK